MLSQHYKAFSKAGRMSIKQEFLRFPRNIREKEKTIISEIRVEAGINGSGYNLKTKEILLRMVWETGTVIHRHAHALERALNLRHNPEFIAVRKAGLALEDSAQTVYDKDAFTKSIQRTKSAEFISVYQKTIHTFRIYLYARSKSINDMYLLECCSEGFRTFYPENELPKKKQSCILLLRGWVMTRNDVLQLNSSFEIWSEAQKSPTLFEDEEVIKRFDSLCQQEYEDFTEQVKEAFGEYNPDMHYDFRVKRNSAND